MLKKANRSKSPFLALWHIVSMEMWNKDYLNAEVQAFIEFKGDGTGNFQFGYVIGYMDWRPTTRDGEPCVEWSWRGGDGADCTELSGHGWAKLKGDQLHGMIFCHQSDDSWFVAKRATVKRSKRK